MVQRYISAEQSIAAAGAAFVCMDDDLSDISKMRAAADNARRYAYLKHAFRTFCKLIGLKQA